MVNLLTAEKLAERWEVPTKRISERITKGAPMPASIKIGAQRLFKISSVVTFEDAMEAETSI